MDVEKVSLFSEVDTNLEVGLHYLEGEVNVVFPKYLNYQEDLKRSTLLLIRTLEKYRNKRIRKTTTDVNKGGESVFYAYIYLIRHYLESGLYEETTKISKLDEKGRINFNKTIAKQMPVIQNRDITYPRVYAYKTVTNNQNEIRQIMKYALRVSFERAGFILGISYNPFSEEKKISSAKALSVLRNRVNSTNSDKEITLLKKLIAVYSKEELNDLKEITNTTIKLNDFNSLFSDLIYNYFGNEELDSNLNDFSLNLLEDGYEIAPSIDTLRLEGKNYYYFLSYYSADDKALPSKSELNKHLEVSRTLGKPVKNIICLATRQVEEVKVLGYVEYNSGRFLVLKFDLEYLMRAYLGNVDNRSKEKVLEVIRAN